jgi:hypothetical protein
MEGLQGGPKNGWAWSLEFLANFQIPNKGGRVITLALPLEDQCHPSDGGDIAGETERKTK